MGVTIPESMGLGGGSFIMFYNSTTKDSYAIDAREEAPKAATHDMFHNNSTLSRLGPLAIGVPGELSGYWELHQRSGRLPWNILFDGAIELSRYGFKVGNHLASAIKSNEEYIRNHLSLRSVI
jgi:gamma-glutamyltranspeptidase/glutathione hydrolase/leukotriene-C4 hydrolase